MTSLKSKTEKRIIRCLECGGDRPDDECFDVDGVTVCAQCLHGGAAPVSVHPIGVVSNTQKRPKTGFGVGGASRASKITLHPGQKRFMFKLEDERRLTIVYYLHAARSVRTRFHRGLDGKEVGVFASRTPDRTSRIAIQDVDLIAVGHDEAILTVEGLDAIDGSPVLDIKLARI